MENGTDDFFKAPSWLVPYSTCENDGCSNAVLGKRVGDKVVPLKDEQNKDVRMCGRCAQRLADKRLGRSMAHSMELIENDRQERIRLGIGAYEVKTAARKKSNKAGLL